VQRFLDSPIVIEPGSLSSVREFMVDDVRKCISRDWWWS